MVYMYILQCSDGSFYVGHTNDLQKRLDCHNSGKGAAHTAAHLPVTMIYAEEFSCETAAITRERQIKRWSRAKKNALVSREVALLKSE